MSVFENLLSRLSFSKTALKVQYAVLTLSGHTAGVHWGGGGVQGENRVLGQFLDGALLCFGCRIQEQTEVFRHRGSHSALRQGAGNRLERKGEEEGLKLITLKRQQHRSRFHPLGTINVYISCRGISVWIKVVDWPKDQHQHKRSVESRLWAVCTVCYLLPWF